MEVKRLLKEYRGIKAKLKILEEEILRLGAAAEGTTITINGQPKTTEISDKVAKNVVKVADAKKEKASLIGELNSQKWYILRIVSKLNSEKQIRVINARYIEDEEKRWEEVAYSLGTSVRQAQRIHGEALKELQDVVEREELGRIEE